MSLLDLFAEINTDLAIGTPGVATCFGRSYLDNQQDPLPRVVWIPVTFVFGPAGNIGGNPRQLATRRQRIEAHCWHEDITNAEALSNNVQASVHHVCHGSYRFVDGVCMSDVTPDTARNGYVISFAFEVDIPVVDAILPVATVSSLPITSVLVYPAGAVVVTTP